MPRYAHGRPLLKAGPSKPPKSKPQRNAALNALETAERQNLDSVKIPQHRLGQIEEDSDGAQTRADTDERSNKRRKVVDDRDEEEDIEGSDLEGGTWHTGVNEDDEDSDLDSDEAFGESDEERFAGYTFRGSTSKQVEKPSTKSRKVKQITLDEGSDSETGRDSGSEQDSDDLGDEAIDLTTAWDLDDVNELEEQRGAKKRADKKSTHKRKATSESEDSEVASVVDDDNTEHDDDEDRESDFTISEDELEGDISGLRTFVEGLSASKPEPKRPSRSESGTLSSQPSRFGLPPSKLSVADLLQYVKDPAQRQSLKILQSAETSGPEAYKGGIPGKLSAPLARRQQDRLDRSAAYEKARDTLNRWIDTVKQNRRAEHLSFPLADHAKDSTPGQKQLVPTSQSIPITELESTIQQIMHESGMGPQKGQSIEDQEQAFEELAEKKMDMDEVKARRAELRMTRELMFREELRAKRIKKIKSKAYRRVHRKERGKIEAQQREALSAAGLLDSDEEREKQDRRRAEERMGARHRESKWAKGVKQAGRTKWDEDAQAGVTDLARRDEELRRRIMGKNATGSDASGDESESDSDYSADTETEGRKLSGRIEAVESAGTSDPKSRLGQMAFMQRAEAARKAENDEELRQIRLAIEDGGAAVEIDEEGSQEPAGRQRFGIRGQAKTTALKPKPKNEFEARLSDDEEEALTLPEPTEIEVDGITPQAKAKVASEVFRTNGAGKQHLKAENPRTGKPALAPNQSSQVQPTILDDYTSSSESDEDNREYLNPDEAKAALAASIFAGPDDAGANFAKEKAELVEEEGDQVVDNTLPGWGSWTGNGVSKREQKRGKGRFLTTIKGVAADKRQDAKLERVIINEKRVKKNGKYLATELPHPYESRQQYERSLRLPIGPEWSTTKHYQDSIKPRVILKQGSVIRPIAKPIA